MDELAVENVVDEVLDVVLVVVTTANMVKRHIHGKLELKELKVVIAKRLSVLEAELDGLQEVDVIVEILLLGELPDEVFDVVLGLEDAIEVECNVVVDRGGVVALLITRVAF